jgi:adenosylcobyric acid synthase
LPGTKNTIADLEWMKAQGLDQWVLEQHANGARVIGICGGYQMLGQRVEDPHRLESSQEAADGLGLLPVTTRLQSEKVTLRVEARSPRGEAFPAYEIHMGATSVVDGAAPFAYVNQQPEGIHANRCIGTYLHGAFEQPGVVEEWLGYRPPPVPTKQRSYDQLAEWFEASADVALFERFFL